VHSVTEFIEAVFEYRFLQIALLAGVLVSVACGVIGSYVVTRRITYIAGSIAHCVLGGIGAARYFQIVHGWELLDPLYGAVVAAMVAAVVIGLVSLRAKEREDTVIGALWAIGMAVGILFIYATSGYNEDLMSYLFGNILMVSSGNLRLIAVLDAIVVGVGIVFYKPLLAVCFDEEFARLRGLHVERYFLLLLCLTALAVVLLVTAVGVILVIALLTLPPAIAGHFSKSLWRMMVISALLSVVFTTVGLAVSYGPEIPSGATIVAIAGAFYLLTILGSFLLRRRHG
jgi:zinc transport system permease protein